MFLTLLVQCKSLIYSLRYTQLYGNDCSAHQHTQGRCCHWIRFRWTQTLTCTARDKWLQLPQGASLRINIQQAHDVVVLHHSQYVMQYKYFVCALEVWSLLKIILQTKAICFPSASKIYQQKPLFCDLIAVAKCGESYSPEWGGALRRFPKYDLYLRR